MKTYEQTKRILKVRVLRDGRKETINPFTGISFITSSFYYIDLWLPLCAGIEFV